MEKRKKKEEEGNQKLGLDRYTKRKYRLKSRSVQHDLLKERVITTKIAINNSSLTQPPKL